MVDPGAPATAEELASWQFSELMYRMLVLGLGAPAFPVNHRDLHEAGLGSWRGAQHEPLVVPTTVRVVHVQAPKSIRICRATCRAPATDYRPWLHAERTDGV